MPTGVYTRTEEHRRILRKKMIKRYQNPEERKKQSEIMTIVMNSPEVRRKCSESHKGKSTWNKNLTKENDERVAMMAKNIKIAHNKPETRKKSREARLGKKTSREIREKQSKSHLERCKDPRERAKISKAMKIAMNRPEVRAKLSESHKIAMNRPETKEKLRNTMMGKMPKNMQRPGKWRNIARGYYNINGKRMFFRSKWEVNYALYLDFLVKYKQIRKWEYEPDVFIFSKIKFGTRSYRPDFKIYNDDKNFEYHEVKGWMTPGSETQIKRMAKYYPEIKLIIIDEDVYEDIRKKLGKMLKFY